MGIPGLEGISLPSGASIISFAIWFFVFIIIAVVLGIALIAFLIRKDMRKVIELDLSTKRMRMFNGRMRKNKNSGIKQFWAAKIKRFLPQFQRTAVFLRGKRDAFILIKDQNGMYHTARLPDYEEIKKWYKVQYNIDLDKDKSVDLEKIRDVYLLPNPHEDLDWLAGQAIEADKEFKLNHWWQSPTVMYIAAIFLCFITWVVTLIIAKKM